MDHALTDMWEDLERVATGKRAMPGLATGIVDFDVLTGGLGKGDLVVVASRPGLGRSTFALSIAIHAGVRSGCTVLCVCSHMTGAALARRAVSNLSGLALDDLRDGRLADADWSTLATTITKLSETSIQLRSVPEVRLDHVAAMAVDRDRERGLDLLILDGLGGIAGPPGRAQQANAAGALKALAMRLGLPVLVTTPIHRPAGERVGAVPDLDAFLSSALIEDADIIAVLDYAEDEDFLDPSSRVMQLDVVKHRSGRAGTVPLFFFHQFGRCQ